MSRLDDVRTHRPFAVWDLLVYTLLVLLIGALFLVFVVLDVFGSDEVNGICVQVRGETAYTYTFGEGGEVMPGWEERIEESRDGNILLVRITAEEGWNELAIDDAAATAVMRDADCSLRKDCTAMRAIGGGGSVITCIPHALKVIPLAGEDLSSPSVG